MLSPVCQLDTRVCEHLAAQGISLTIYQLSGRTCNAKESVSLSSVMKMEAARFSTTSVDIIGIILNSNAS
jgi:hypothetical protein